MTCYECSGDQAFDTDNIRLEAHTDCLTINICENGSDATILIDDKDKVKEIARVLLAYLKEDK